MEHNLDRAHSVTGPVFESGFGWRVSLFFGSEEAAQGFAAFATAGGTAHTQVASGPPRLLWVPLSGAEPVGPLPPQPILAIHSVDITDDKVVRIGYRLVGIG